MIDYLVDEVMSRQPEQVQVFLRRTSVLDQFCAALCEYVIGSSRDPDIIEYLDRANLFLVPLDDRREWYRYHHLIGDFLRQRLRETERDTTPELHRRARQWYEKAGGVDEAIQHALAAGDLESATRLVDEIAIDLIVRAEAHKLLRLIDQLPADLRQDYPMLGIGHVWALHFMGQPEMAAQALALLEARQNTAPRVPNPGYVMTVRAYLTTRQGDVLKAIRLSEQALEEMSKGEPDRYTLIF